MAEPFVWRGQPVDTIGDLTSVLGSIVESKDATAASDFRQAYRETNEHADANIGYCLGYLSQEQMVAGLRLFDVEHPVFGGAQSAEGISPEQAFEMGRQLGIKERDDDRHG